MFEDQSQFAFAAELERQWTVIRDEMIALRETGFIAWPEKSLYGETGWSTFGLYAFGQKQAENCALCPRTTALVESIPGMSMAGFSRLAPGAPTPTPVWNPEPGHQALVWKAGEIQFELYFFAGPQYDGPALTQADLILIAESLK